jgi:hypothetical protein
MLARTAYAAGGTVRWLVILGSVSLVALIMTPGPVLAIIGLVLGADRIAYVAEVLGGLLAALAVRAEIRELRFGTARPAIRFRVRNAQVSLGLPFGYWMNHRTVSTGRHAVVLLGGPLANLALAGIVQAFPLPRAIASSLAVMFVAHAVEELIPVRANDGRTSAGDQLLHLRPHGLLMELDDFWANRDSRAHSPGLTNRVLVAYQEGVPEARLNAHLLAMLLRREGRVAELLELHAGLAEPDAALDEAYRGAFVELEWSVLAVPGLPVAEADRAAVRLERLPKFSRPDRQISLATTLALARLRQGRFADVEPLCADALAGELEPDKRARVLAAVVLARRALGHPYAELIAEAESLSPDDDLVAEAAATGVAGR